MKRDEILRICQAVHATPTWTVDRYPDSDEVTALDLTTWCGHEGHGKGHCTVKSYAAWEYYRDFGGCPAENLRTHPYPGKVATDDPTV